MENSNYGLQRNIPFMRKVSQVTGINVIAGTGNIFSQLINRRIPDSSVKYSVEYERPRARFDVT